MKGGDTITYYISIGIACALLILVSSVIFAKKRKIRDTLIFISAIGFVLFAMIPSLLKRMAGTYVVALYSLILLAVSVIHTLISKKKNNKIENSYDDYLQRSASKTRHESLSPVSAGSVWNSGEAAVAGSPMDFDWGSQEDSQTGSEVQLYQADVESSFQNYMSEEDNFSTKRFEITGKDTNEELRAKLRGISLEVPIDVASAEEKSSDQERNVDDMYDEMIYGQREALNNLIEEAGANCEKETENIPLQKNVLGNPMEKEMEQSVADILEVLALSDERVEEEPSESQISIDEPDTSVSEELAESGEDLLMEEASEEIVASSSEEEEKSALLSAVETGAEEEVQTEKPFSEMGFTEKFKLYVESQKRQLPPRPSILDGLALDEQSESGTSALEEPNENSFKEQVAGPMELSAEESIPEEDTASQDSQDAFAEKFKKYVQQHRKEAAPVHGTPKEFLAPIHAFGSSDRMNQEDVDRAVAAMVGTNSEVQFPDQEVASVEVRTFEEPVQNMLEAEIVVGEIEANAIETDEIQDEADQIQEEMEAKEEVKVSVEIETVSEEVEASAEIAEEMLSKDDRMKISSEQENAERKETIVFTVKGQESSSMSLFEDIEEAPRYGIAMGTELGAFLEQSDLDEAASAIFAAAIGAVEDETLAAAVEENSPSMQGEEEIRSEFEVEESVAEVEIEEPAAELEEAELETEELERAQEQSVAAETEEPAIEEAEMKEPAAEPEELEEEVAVAEVEIEEPAAELEEAELETEELERAQEQSVAAETEEPAIEEAEMKEPAAEPEELEEEAVFAEIEIEESAAKPEELEEVVVAEIEEPEAELEEAELETEELERAQEQSVAAETEEPAIEEAEMKEPAAELEELEEEAVFAEIEIEELAAKPEELEEEVSVAEVEIEEPAAQLEELEEEVTVAEVEIEEPAAELEELEEEAVFAEIEIEEPAAEFEEFEEEVSVAEVEIEEPAAEFEEFEEEVSVAEVEIEEPAAEFEEFEEEVAVAEIEIEEEKAEAPALDEDEIKHEILTQEEDAYVEIRNKRTISKVFSQAMYQKALENLEKGQVLEAVEKLSNLVVHSTDENIMISSYFKLKDLLGSSDEEMLEITRKLLLAHQDINGVYVDIIKKYMKDVI